MTLVDLIEMLADWRAATERDDDGHLGKSMHIQRERFGIGEQLWSILWNTAERYRWIPDQPCGATHDAANSGPASEWVCNVPVDRNGRHSGRHEDGRHSPGAEWPNDDPAPA